MTTDTLLAAPASHPARVPLGQSFHRYWWANVISAFGDNLRSVSLSLLAVTLTHDARLISVISVASFLPWIVAGPFGGRLKQKPLTILLGVNAFRAFLTALFTLAVALGQVNIALICATTALLTTVSIFMSASAVTFFPRLVPESELRRGNARLEGGRSISGQFLGAPIGGVLFAFNHVLPLAVDSATFVIALILMSGLRSAEETCGSDGSPDPHDGGGGAMRFLLGRKGMLAVAILLGAVNLVSSAIGTILVLFTVVGLHAGSSTYGLLASCLAAGAFVGSLLVTRILNRVSVPVALAAAVLVRVGALLLLGLTSSAIVAGAALIVQGITMTTWNVISTTLTQTLTPKHLVGQVSSLVKTIAISTAPLGAILGGVSAKYFGIRSPMVIGGAVVFIAGLLCVRAVGKDPVVRLA